MAEKEEKKEEKGFLMVMVELMDDYFNVLDLKSILKIKEYNPEAEEGVVFGVQVNLYSNPFKYSYWFNTEQERDDIFFSLIQKLIKLGVKFV